MEDRNLGFIQIDRQLSKGTEKDQCISLSLQALGGWSQEDQIISQKYNRNYNLMKKATESVWNAKDRLKDTYLQPRGCQKFWMSVAEGYLFWGILVW